jgi:predicted ferric reductase
MTAGARYAPTPVYRARALPRPALRDWWSDGVGLAVWASLLVVVALWEHNRGLPGLAGGESAALITLGRLAGLVGADLLLLQVITMARVPWMERALGQDRLARWHRVLGFTSVNLVALHIVLITLGYALADATGPLGELWSLVWTAPGMLLAAAGTGLLVLVTVTSVRAARRRTRYESWHLLHLYAYLGVGLALPHQLWTGADFIGSTAATVYWWSLWALALITVVTFRLVRPLRTSLRHRLTVASVQRQGPGVVTVRVTGRRLDELAVAAGQFFVWRFMTGPGWTRGHPFSLSGAPTTDGLQITVAVTGDDGARLAAMRPGTRAFVEGPYGRLTPAVRTRPGLALIGSGLGVAPLVAVLQDAARFGTLNGPATLVRRIRTAGPQPLDDALAGLERTGRVRIVDLVGPRSTAGGVWLPAHTPPVPGADALRLLIPDLDACDLYVCGASPWAKAVAVDARAAGVPTSALHVEHFSW